jgi:multiple sugar transport system substrate-binding protein
VAGRGRLTGLVVACALAMTALVACGDKPSAPDHSEITVWDYYGAATPIKPAVAAFEKAHPEITVRYQAREYDDVQIKFGKESGSATGPDVSTLDMTWLPSFAADGLLADLNRLSGGRVNNRRFEHTYGAAALGAMSYQGKYVAAPFDFDTYALYYRADLLKQQGIAVPKTWTELRKASRKLAAAAEESGQKGKWRTLVTPDTFHFAQVLFQHGGDFLNSTNTRAAFAGPQGVQALTAYRGLLRDGGVYLGAEQPDSAGTDRIKDGRIAMFINGPYMMGVLKDTAAEQSGKWGVAPVPSDGHPGSYLGGTGLAIPAKSRNKAAAWTFVQFMLKKEQELGVLKYAGAAPTTNEAVLSAELTDPDPYFGGQTPFLVFLEAVSSARHFPYIKQWSEVDATINEAVAAVLLDKKTPKQALTDAAAKVDKMLAG